MNVQNIGNNNISNKGLYFTNRSPIVKGNVHYSNLRGVKISDLGARYVEDTSYKITPGFKRFFMENPVIKTMQKTKDIFVQYFGEQYDKNCNEYKSSLRLYILDKDSDCFRIADFIEYDKKSETTARAKLIKKIFE